MTGHSSLYQKHRSALPQLTSSCFGCASAEDKIQALLDRVAGAISKDPSTTLGFDFELPRSELVQRWLNRFDSDLECPLCPDLKGRIEALVTQLLDEGAAMGSLVVAGGGKRKRIDRDVEAVRELLKVVRSACLDPCDPLGIDREWRKKILAARKALFLRVDEITNVDEFPYPRKLSNLKYLCTTNGSPGFSYTQTGPTRKSQRKVLKIGDSELPRKRVPIGPSFQAEIPDITSPQSHEDRLHNSRWVGTQIWPIKGIDRRSSRQSLGKKFAHSCQCRSPGSVECVRLHVSLARRQLKSELGLAFSSLGFSEMGEEVAKLWTQEEQIKFDDIVRQNPPSEGKSFMEPALKYFTDKSRKDIVCFYFNVYVLRWMSTQTRLGTSPVDSSDDENSGCD